MDEDTRSDGTTVRWSGEVGDPGERESRTWLQPGATVDHFRVLRLLGRGGMGEVFLARDLRLGRRVALKILRARDIGSSSAVERFLVEARTTARFAHPNIITVHFAGEVDDNPYLALEYLEGQTLRQRMVEGRLGVREAARIGLSIASALKEAHRHGILHRDLKPENVMIPADGRVRVLDFGLAKQVAGEASAVAYPEPQEDSEDASLSLGSTDLTQQDEIRGTPAYMAPEQWSGEAVTEAADLWALGLVLYEILAGQHPFAGLPAALIAARVNQGEPIPRLTVDAPEELVALLEICLVHSPASRAPLSDVIAVLERIVDLPVSRTGHPSSPFPGLLPCQERDAANFHGRDGETHAFVELMRRETVLPVVGPSGAGKSSFVQAGVLPRLREQGRWVVISMRPGRRPMHTLAARLSSPGGWQTRTPRPTETQDTSWGTHRSGEAAELDGEALAAQLRDSPTRLALKLDEIAELEEARVLLLVDQLEELYSLVDDAELRRTFMEALCSAADDPQGSTRVVFTLRDDFLGRVAEGPAARAALGHATVLRAPGKENLREILQRSVESVGFGFDDPDLVEEMVTDLEGERSALPLIQVAGRALWEGRDPSRKLLLRATYDQLGGIAGALAHHADGVLQGMSGAQVRIVRTILLRLVTADGLRKVTGREEVLHGLPGQVGEVLDRLVAGRLLTVRRARGEGAAGAEVELVHESLIQGWDRLSRWIDGSREEIAFLAEVGQAAELWERRGRRREEVWYGDALAEAQRSLARCTQEVPRAIEAFLDAGVGEQQRVVRRRRTLTTAGVALLALIALSAVWVAFDLADKERETDLQRIAAEEGRASAQWEAARAAYTAGDPLQARAKLRGSMETLDTPEARALWRQLAALPLIWTKDLGTQPNDVICPPHGTSVAVAGQNRSIYLIDRISSEVSRVLRGGQDQVYWLKFSDDGKRLGGYDWSGRLILWAVADRWRQMILQPDVEPTLASLSPDGSAFVGTDATGRILRFPLDENGRSRTVATWDAPFRTLDISPDSRLVAGTDRSNAAPIFDLVSGDRVAHLQGHTDRVVDVEFDPDGRRIATGSVDGTARIWDVASGSCSAVLRGAASSPKDVAFTSGGRQLVAGAANGDVMLWDLQRPDAPLLLGSHGDLIYEIASVPGEPLVFTCGNDGSVRLWDTTIQPLDAPMRGHDGTVRKVGISPDGRTVASAGQDGTIRLWDVRSGAQRATIHGHDQSVTDVAFDPAAEVVASSSHDGTARLWNPQTGELSATLTGHGRRVEAVVFSPDGERVATGAWDGTARLWDREDGRLLEVMETGARCVYDLEFSPDGRILATMAPGGYTALWDAATGERVRELEPGCGSAWGLAFDRKGRHLACASEAGKVYVYDVRRGALVTTLEVDARTYGVDFHPDGERVAVPCSDGVVRVFDVGSGEALEIHGHRDEVADSQFTADGRHVATASDDGTVRLWSTDTGLPVWETKAVVGSPPVILTHDGWSSFDGSPVDPPPAEWAGALEERARTSSVAGETLCMWTRDRQIEIWDIGADRGEELAVVRDVDHLQAVPGGCVSLVDGVARLHRTATDDIQLLSGATAAVWESPDLLVVGREQIQVFSASGETTGTFEGAEGATAVARGSGRLILGFGDGSVEMRPLSGDAAIGARFLQDVPSSSVVRLTHGPADTVLAGYASGAVGLWNPRTGTQLASWRLHGPVVHLTTVGHSLHAATRLGDSMAADLEIFSRDYCELMTEVWEQVPVVWQEGVYVVRSSPEDHECALQREGGVAR